MVKAVEGSARPAVHDRRQGSRRDHAGKSGTAELGGTGEPHSWFIGFAPANAPKVAIAVIVEQAGRGARSRRRSAGT
jgi:cell division protein FtsI/penicillin-binding protein 2